MVWSRLVALVSVPVAAVVAAGVALGGARVPASAANERLAAATASTNLLTNPGFESGLSGWTCSAGSARLAAR
jgi:hypothetical protein